MPATSLNLPLYRVLRSLNVPETDAAAASEAPPAPFDPTNLATREELSTGLAQVRAEIAGVRAEIAGVRTEIAQTAQRQTIWLAAAVFAAAGLVVAILRLAPVH